MFVEPDILRQIGLSNFTVIDLETTGLEYLKNEIIEFGAVRYRDGKPAETLNLLFKPSVPIPQSIIQITGITNENVKDAPGFAARTDELTEFIGADPVIAHNVDFDLPFLEYHLRRSVGRGVGEIVKEYEFLPNDKYDTLLLSRIFLPFQHHFSLKALAGYFKIEREPSHRAIPDAQATGELFLRLVEIALRTDFKDLRRITDILDATDNSLKNLFFRLTSLLASGKYTVPSGIDKETFWYAANFYNIIGEEDTPQHGSLETNSINESEIADFFAPDGVLAKTFGTYEYRESQQRMAQETAMAFNSQQFLVVEAGTGTGKSLAYLLPAIKWAIQNYGPYGRVIISTNTKNLQEQLFFKDLPILHSILKETFKVVLLKGKSNYLCLDKWFTNLGDMDSRLSSSERLKMLPLYLWTKNTETGDISENGAFAVERNMGLWTKFIAENNYCPGKSCKYYGDCFLMRARNNARDAHLVLVNHSLLFSDLAADQAILSDYTNLILDEAHNIEKTATDYLGMDISIWSFRDTFRKLYHREKYETGLLSQFRKRLQLGELEESRKKLILGHIDDAIPLVQSNWSATQGFFRAMTSELRTLLPGSQSNSYSVRFRYRREDGLHSKVEAYFDELVNQIRRLMSSLNGIIDILREIPEDSFKYQKQVYQELLSQLTQLDALKTSLEYLVLAEWDDWVYWFELPKSEYADDCKLYAAPLNIENLLNEKLYQKLRTAIFTSATLTIERKFDYFLKRNGLYGEAGEKVKTLLLDSPFFYNEQVLLGLPTFMPDPRAAEFNVTLKLMMEQIAKQINRGTLVLFTSYYMLNELYNGLRITFEAEKVPLLAQGKNGSRHAIITNFKEKAKSILFGTDSFWTGIDVPGEALEILVITKLPFDVPSEPVIQAKLEKIQREGGNPFMDYTIPEAVIKLRQGFGRLIRAQSDYGAVIILDNRITRKMYGKYFLNSLPVRPQMINSIEEMVVILKKWFEPQG